jgi:hypothetical protein
MKIMMLLITVLAVRGTLTAQLICDQSIEAVDLSERAYKDRGNRCEGFYRSEVGANRMDLLGVLKGMLVYELDTAEVIELSVASSISRTVSIRAQAVPLKMYYRMDARLNPGDLLKWPVREVLLPDSISYEHISVFGSYSEGSNDIYVPVISRARSNTIANDNILRFVFRPTVNIENIKFNYFIYSSGETIGWLQNLRGSCLAGRPLMIELESAPAEKLRLTVAALVQGSQDEWLEIQTVVDNR